MSEPAPHDLIPPAGVSELVEAAREAERQARHTVARRRYEAALRRLRGPGYAPVASSLIRWIGRTHGAEGDHDAALDCYEAALAVAEACGSLQDAAHAVNWKANVAFARSQLDEAEALYGQARRMAEEGDERRLMAMIDQNLGIVANVHGDFAKAMAYYRAGLTGYQRLGRHEYMGPLLNNKGRLHTDLKEWADAELSFSEALRYCEEVGDQATQIVVRVNLTRLAIARGDFERARVHGYEAHEVSVRLGEERWLGEIKKYAGVVFASAGQLALAEESLQEAQALAQGREDLLLEAEVNRELAVLYRRQERNTEVLRCLNRAQAVFRRLRARTKVADVEREITRLERDFLQLVQEWGESIESKDRYTQGHCRRVADYATALAEAAGLDPGCLVWFRMGALLHDVGKVVVPSEILNKEGPLTPQEWEIMKSHPGVGVELLAGAAFPWDIRPMVRHHHERWDGTGYPQGLAGEAIPLSARILCLADAFDALTTNRSYRGALCVDVALEIMEGDAGHVFDPGLFTVFRECVPPLFMAERASGAEAAAVQRLPTWDAVLSSQAERLPPRWDVA